MALAASLTDGLWWPHTRLVAVSQPSLLIGSRRKSLSDLDRLGSHRQSKPEWRRSLLVRSGAKPFSSDDIKYLEHKVHAVLCETGEVTLGQAVPRGNLSAVPRNPDLLDACADTIVAVLRLTGTLI